MKKILFSKHGETGVALIAVILTITLVTALFVMSFTNGLIGKLVTQAHSRGRVAAQCAQGSFEIANAILVQVASTGIIEQPTGLPEGVTVKINNPNGQLVSESRGSKALVKGQPLSNDDPKVSPNITVVDGPCTTAVDVDYVLYSDDNPGEEKTFATAYHEPIGGTACAEGGFYYMTAITTNGKAVMTSRSGYFKCPG
jgi:hypothetical protein